MGRVGYGLSFSLVPQLFLIPRASKGKRKGCGSIFGGLVRYGYSIHDTWNRRRSAAQQKPVSRRMRIPVMRVVLHAVHSVGREHMLLLWNHD